MGSRPRILTVVVVAAALGAACQNGSGDQVQAPVDLGITSSMAAYYQDQNTTMYQAQTPVALPVKKPSSSDMQKLGSAPAGTPYPHAPWLTADDERVEVRYTVSNIDDQDHNVWLLVDPWNEFVRWAPGVSVVNDEQTTPNYGYDLYFPVPAKSRVEGTFTTDDMHEIAIKLASAMNLLASPQAQAAAGADAGMQNGFDATAIANNIFNPQNRSNGGDPLYTPWIPPVIAGVTGFDLGLRTMEQANVAVEIIVEVQDVNGNRFVQPGASDPQLGPPPATLSPPSARF